MTPTSGFRRFSPGQSDFLHLFRGPTPFSGVSTHQSWAAQINQSKPPEGKRARGTGDTSTDAGTREHTDAQKHRHTDTPPRETQPPPLVPRGPAPGNAARSRPYTSRSITSRTMRASAITVERTTHCAARVILLVAVGDHSTLPASRFYAVLCGFMRVGLPGTARGTLRASRGGSSSGRWVP